MLDIAGVLAQLIACVEAELTTPPCVVCTTSGAPVADYCCECDDGTGSGQLTGNVTQTFEANPDTLRPAPSVRPCRPMSVAAEYRIVLARCHPVQDERGRPPTCEQLQAAADLTATDIEEMWQALTCCPTGLRIRIGSIGVEGNPLGGCVAVVAVVTVLLDGAV